MKAISTVHDIFLAATGPFMPPAGVVVEENPHHSFVYTITGCRESVDRATQKIFNDYHPAGYGTRLKSLRKLDDGNTEVIIWRAASCE